MFQNNTEWSEDRTQRLRELAALGHSATEIGAALGVSRCAVIGKAQRCNIRIDSRGGGYAIREPAPPAKADFWTEEKVDLLRRIVGDDRCWSAAAIGAMLGTSRSSVIKKCQRAQITLGRTKGDNGAARYATEAEALSMGVTLPPDAPVGKPRDRAPPRRPRIESTPLRAAAVYAGEPVVELAPIFTPEPTVTHEEPMFTGGVAIWDLRDVHCRYIVRGGGSGGVASFDPHDVRYCGETVEQGSWCATHRKLFCRSLYEVRKMRAEAASG